MGDCTNPIKGKKMTIESTLRNFIPNPELLELWIAQSQNHNSGAEPSDNNSEELPNFNQEKNPEIAKPSPEPNKAKLTEEARAMSSSQSKP